MEIGGEKMRNSNDQQGENERQWKKKKNEQKHKQQGAWNSSDCFESFSPLNNVWIDRPLMPSSDVTHYPKTG